MAHPFQRVQAAVRRPRAVEWMLLVAYAGVGLSMSAPWVRGEPFLNGFMGSPEKPARVIYGIEAVGPLALVALAGLLAVFLVRSQTLRSWTQMGLWAFFSLIALGFEAWGGFLCFLCENREVLWGPAAFQASAVLGLVLATMAIDWGKTFDRLQTAIGR